jgi:hypothetical protein
MIKMIEINEWDIKTATDGIVINQMIGSYHAKPSKTVDDFYKNRIDLIEFIKNDVEKSGKQFIYNKYK